MRAERKIIFLGIFSAFFFLGCAGENYVRTNNANGLLVTQGGRIGFFGTDNSWVHIAPENSGPAVFNLRKTYSRIEDSWEQKCPDPKQRRNFKHKEIKEETTEDFINSHSQGNFAFGSNASTGNWAAPAAVVAGGMVGAAAVHRPDNNRTNISGVGGGARSNANAGANAEARGGDAEVDIKNSVDNRTHKRRW